MAPSRERSIFNGSTSDSPTPDLASRLHVERKEGDYASYATTKVDLPSGALFARITTATPTKKSWSSVQVGEDSHIELNSELVFINHSCDPNLVFDMAKFEVRVHEGKELKKGDNITFFYPSSEWNMAQPFECSCGSEKCLGTIKGAGQIEEEVIRRFWLNEHIVKMLDARKTKNGTNGHANGHAN
ncbi:galactose-proton symport [Tothia fuscella]|uniref:Galactose-proton symport n=1 Tax=Tothia fuscella TaxID=1048955 RepID=A0A9P4TWQ5_9PEZI|nr:galactose-proton symport [Tothia fuscella]